MDRERDRREQGGERERERERKGVKGRKKGRELYIYIPDFKGLISNPKLTSPQSPHTRRLALRHMLRGDL